MRPGVAGHCAVGLRVIRPRLAGVPTVGGEAPRLGFASERIWGGYVTGGGVRGEQILGNRAQGSTSIIRLQ